MQVIKVPSPNFFTDNSRIQSVILHGTSGPLQASIDWLRNPQPSNPDNRVSANYLISKAGVVYELVDYKAGKRAMANGVVENYDSSLLWLSNAVKNRVNPNYITVSIEHEASYQEMINHASMTDAQFTSSVELTANILRYCRLKATHESVAGHNQISGNKKFNCPGVINVPAYVEQLLIRNPDLK